MEYSRELFERLECTTVDKAIDQFLEQRERILKLSEKDTVRSAAFYAAFRRLSDEFVKEIRQREFPHMTEELWGYDIDFDHITIELVLAKYIESVHIDEDGKTYPMYDREVKYSLFQVEAKLLSIDEYARHYGIDPKTVTQWIRRGKIRTAKKLGNSWMIPEVTDTPSRGYTSGRYNLDADMRPLSDEYGFLEGAKSVMIRQNDDDKSMYIVSTYDKDEGLLEPNHVIEFTQKEKEKFELGLIAHPGARYVPDFRETLIPDLMEAYSNKDDENT